MSGYNISSLARLTALLSLVLRLQAGKMVELRSRQLSDANLTEYKNYNLSYNKLREAEGTRGIIPIRHEKARRGRSVLLS